MFLPPDENFFSERILSFSIKSWEKKNNIAPEDTFTALHHRKKKYSQPYRKYMLHFQTVEIRLSGKTRSLDAFDFQVSNVRKPETRNICLTIKELMVIDLLAFCFGRTAFWLRKGGMVWYILYYNLKEGYLDM